MTLEDGRLIGAHENEGRVKERNFDILPTHIPDFFLLVDHGTEPDLTRSQTRKLRDIGNIYGARAEIIKYLQELQEEPHGELVDLGINFPGLRGGRDLEAGIETQITAKTENVFDESRLDESLGEQRPDYVHKKVIVTIELNPDRDDVDGFITSAKRRLKRQGFKAEEIDKMLTVKKTLRIDEKALKKLIEKGDVKLMPDAWKTRVKNWSITSRDIPSAEQLAEADEKAKESQLTFGDLT